MASETVHDLLERERGTVRAFGRCCMFAGGIVAYVVVGEMPKLVGLAVAPWRPPVQAAVLLLWMAAAGGLVAISVSMIRTGQLVADAAVGLVNGGNDRRTGAWPVAATIEMPTIRADGVVVRRARVVFR